MGRKKTITDEELLEAARQVFLADGIGASTKSIARNAGISEGVIFQRFKTKEELFFAAMIPPPVDVNRIMQHPGLVGYELIEKITFAMLEYSRIMLPVLTPLTTHPSFRFEEFADRNPQSPLFTLRRELTAFFIREKQANRIGDVHPGAAALLVWSTAHSIAFFESLGAHGGKFEPEIVRATVRCMWNGMAPTAVRPAPRRKRQSRATIRP